MLRYVVLHHDGIEPPHFDLMFETAPLSPLSTWRSPAWPIEKSARLTRLGDHRRDYLTYQGPLTNVRGSVRRVAEGTCELEIRSELIWHLTFLTPAPPRRLRLLALTADLWLASD